MKGVTIKPFKEEDSHKYHGQDEKLGYVRPLNKPQTTKNVFPLSK